MSNYNLWLLLFEQYYEVRQPLRKRRESVMCVKSSLMLLIHTVTDTICGKITVRNERWPIGKQHLKL